MLCVWPILLKFLSLHTLVAGESYTPHLRVTLHRPPSDSWRRSRCGGNPDSADIATKWADQVSANQTPLQEYPRPQMVRKRAVGWSDTKLRDLGDNLTWFNLNGLWEWERATSIKPTFNRTLNHSILVPYPVESCLSGVASYTCMSMWYRITFDHWINMTTSRTLLHFGAVDWFCVVYLNANPVGNHTGGYDSFSFDITDYLAPFDNELLIYVYDPSNYGDQPNGKQNVNAVRKPGGFQYTPSSGIWQTVWLEVVPRLYVSSLQIDQSSSTQVTVTATLAGDGMMHFRIGSSGDFTADVPMTINIIKHGKLIVSTEGLAGFPSTVLMPEADLWSPDSPTLYDLEVTVAYDTVEAYFGLRTVMLGSNAMGAVPQLNGESLFLQGVLDQGYWPDGLYTAPTDEALEADILATKSLGFNMIRMHQKVSPERWYYYADKHGLIVFQDMVQKYFEAKETTVLYFMHDLKAVVKGRGNHPCITQWIIFNEDNCWMEFTKSAEYNIQDIVDFITSLDPSRLVDAASGGSAHTLRIGAVNDIHTYPEPGFIFPTELQYAMVGEWGGIGYFLRGREWVPGGCSAYKEANTPLEQADLYVHLAKKLQASVCCISAAVYTQLVDVELECNGFFTYDRTPKFDEHQTQMVRRANLAVIRERRNQTDEEAVASSRRMQINPR